VGRARVPRPGPLHSLEPPRSARVSEELRSWRVGPVVGGSDQWLAGRTSGWRRVACSLIFERVLVELCMPAVRPLVLCSACTPGGAPTAGDPRNGVWSISSFSSASAYPLTPP
jgi:hypothetical protein